METQHILGIAPQQPVVLVQHVHHHHHHHTAAPVQVRVDVKTSVIDPPRFDERPPAEILAHRRVTDDQYRAMIKGLNDKLRSPSSWRTAKTVCVVAFTSLTLFVFFGRLDEEVSWMSVCTLLLTLASCISWIICLYYYELEVSPSSSLFAFRSLFFALRSLSPLVRERRSYVC
jgi:hypothetical protein